MRWSQALALFAVSLSLTSDGGRSEAGRQEGKQGQAETQLEGLPYREGTVFSLVFVRTKPGLTHEYLKTAATGWRRVAEQLKKDGLILSYKVFLGSAANKDDWDVMLMLEFKDMAALEGIDGKIQALFRKIIGPEHQVEAGYVKRAEMRDVLGQKVVREVILK
jgi:hypothetical protein